MNKKILVVDDEPIITATLSNMISLITSHEVIESNEPAQALDILKSQPIDLILSDFMMPGMNGLEFLKKAKEIRPEVIAILLTGYADKENAIRSINEVGLYYYLEKPWDNESLLKIVENALERNSLSDDLKNKLVELEKANKEVAKLYAFLKKDFNKETENIRNIIVLLANLIEAKDEYTQDHARRVGIISRKLAEKLGLSEERASQIELSGIIHDIGKISVSETILNKPGRLTEEEFDIMKKHTIVGEMICKPLNCLKDSLDAIRHHHEKLDGSGYPDGLKDDEISIDARIVAVADIFDALNSKRSYHEKFPLSKIRDILFGDADNGKLDKDIVSLLFQIIKDGEAGDFING